jgi:hypothetical protein
MQSKNFFSDSCYKCTFVAWKKFKEHTFLIFGINVSGKLQQSHDNLTISAEGSMMQRNEPDEIVQNKCKR